MLSPPKGERQDAVGSLVHGAAGLAAGSAATLLLMPLDFTKTAMQAHGWWVNEGGGRSRLRVLDVVKPTFQQKGCVVRGFMLITGIAGIAPFFSGGWSAMWASGIAWGGYMFAYGYSVASKQDLIIPSFDFFKQTARNMTGQQVLSAWHIAACACLGGASQSLLTHPLFMIKTRTQLQSRLGAEAMLPQAQPYRGVTDALTRIVREEGMLGLYRGYSASLLLTVHGSVQFTAFEKLNQWMLTAKREASPSTPPASISLNGWEVSASAALSKTLAGTLTYPMTLVKTRLQDRRNAAMFGPVSYRGLADTLVKIVQHEGVLALYKGLLPSLARSLPLNTLILVMYQKLFLPLFTLALR